MAQFANGSFWGGGDLPGEVGPFITRGFRLIVPFFVAFLRRHISSDMVIRIESLRVGRRKIAENQLGGTLGLGLCLSIGDLPAVFHCCPGQGRNLLIAIEGKGLWPQETEIANRGLPLGQRQPVPISQAPDSFAETRAISAAFRTGYPAMRSGHGK